MTGPAQKARSTQASISTPTGAASLTRNRGVMVSSELQNKRMPVRPRAIMPASPESSTAATRDQAANDGVSVLEVCSAADNKENLAMKPDSGGKPVISKAQAMKDMPRNAMAAGMATPTTSSERSAGSGSSRSKASRLTASRSAPKAWVRSTISSSMNKAPSASTELIR